MIWYGKELWLNVVKIALVFLVIVLAPVLCAVAGFLFGIKAWIMVVKIILAIGRKED